MALLLAVACGLWLWLRGEVSRRLDAAPAAAAAQGVRLTLGARRFDGFPFRIRATLGPARAALGTGWAVEAPSLVLQAYVFEPTRWVAVAPSGLLLDRPDGGGVRVSGAAIRASLSGRPGRPWRFAGEGRDLRFTPAPGARPFGLLSVSGLEAEAKPSSRPGETDVLLEVDHGVAAPESAVWHVASGSPFDLLLTGRFGPDAFSLERLEARAGPTEVSGAGGALGVGADGRLEGAIPLQVRQAPQAAAATPGTPAAVAIARAKAAGANAALPLVFDAGQARLGPFRLGPAPRVRP